MKNYIINMTELELQKDLKSMKIHIDRYRCWIDILIYIYMYLYVLSDIYHIYIYLFMLYILG